MLQTHLPLSKPMLMPAKPKPSSPITFTASPGVFLIQPNFEKGGCVQEAAKLLTLKKLVNPSGSDLPQVTRISNKTQLKTLWKALDQKTKDMPNINWEIHQPVLVTLNQKFEAKSLDRVRFFKPFTTLQAPRSASVFELTVNTGPFGRPAEGMAWYLGVMEKSVLDTLPKVDIKPSNKPVYFP
jgi:hypothetical protein